MKQPYTEDQIIHMEGVNTGNHKRPSTPGASNSNAFGDTRTGAENVEDFASDKAESVETGTDLDKVSGLDETHASQKVVDKNHFVERAPERDERGRI